VGFLINTFVSDDVVKCSKCVQDVCEACSLWKGLKFCKKREYIDCMSAKGENFSAEALFLILIFEQQKMINELIGKLSVMKK
jgi:hypothetical protein